MLCHATVVDLMIRPLPAVVPMCAMLIWCFHVVNFFVCGAMAICIGMHACTRTCAERMRTQTQIHGTQIYTNARAIARTQNTRTSTNAGARTQLLAVRYGGCYLLVVCRTCCLPLGTFVKHWFRWCLQFFVTYERRSHDNRHTQMYVRTCTHSTQFTQTRTNAQARAQLLVVRFGACY